MGTLLFTIPGAPDVGGLPKLPYNTSMISSDGFSGAVDGDVGGRNTDIEFGGTALVWTTNPANAYGVDGAGHLVEGSYTAGIKGVYLNIGSGNKSFDVKVDELVSNTYFDFQKNEPGLNNTTTSCYRLNVGATGLVRLFKKSLGVGEAVISTGTHTIGVGDVVGARYFGGLLAITINGIVVEEVDDTAAKLTGNLWELFQGATSSVKLGFVKFAALA